MTDIIFSKEAILFSIVLVFVFKIAWSLLRDYGYFTDWRGWIKKKWKEYKKADTLKQIYIPVAFVVLACLSVLFFRLLDDVLAIPTSENEGAVRNTAIAFLGTVSGIGALFGVWLAIRRSDENKRQNDVAQKQADIAEQGSITDRINKATEGLGKNDGEDPVVEVRLGSLLALERIAQDSLRDHISIMEILCAYVRTNSPRTPETDEADKTIPLREDIQVALTIIGRRERWEDGKKYLAKETERGYRIDLHNCDLHGAQLDRANLNKANLIKADLRNAQIITAKLNGTQFENADMTHAELGGSKAINARFNGANLKQAGLEVANLKNAWFYNADLTNAWLFDSDLSDASFHNAKLNNVSLVNANLNKTRISTADMDGAELNGAFARECDFSRCKNLTQDQIEEMFCRIDVDIPDGLEHPDHWPGDELDDTGFDFALREWQDMKEEEAQEDAEMHMQMMEEKKAKRRLAREEAREEKIQKAIDDEAADLHADMQVGLEKDSRGE